MNKDREYIIRQEEGSKGRKEADIRKNNKGMYRIKIYVCMKTSH